MIPVIYESYNIARQPLLFGDQVMLKEMLDRLPGAEMAVGFVNGVGQQTGHAEGAVITIPLHHNEQYMSNLNADIHKLKWVIIIMTANEFGSDAYRELKHPNMKIWLQTPKQSDAADRFIPIGYPTEVKRTKSKKQYDWFFSGQVNHAKRQECVEQLRQMDGGKLVETGGFWQGLEHPDYINLMAQSKLVPCPSGPETPDTFRLYEALEMGCVPVVDSPWYWEKIFGPDHPIPVVNDWVLFKYQINNYLADYDKLKAKIDAWWSDYKFQLESNLINDIKELRSKV